LADAGGVTGAASAASFFVAASAPLRQRIKASLRICSSAWAPGPSLSMTPSAKRRPAGVAWKAPSDALSGAGSSSADSETVFLLAAASITVASRCCRFFTMARPVGLAKKAIAASRSFADSCCRYCCT
jgi:hypothetical protein